MSTKCLNCERRLAMTDGDYCEPCLAIENPVVRLVQPRRRKPPRIARRDWQRPLNHGDGK